MLALVARKSWANDALDADTRRFFDEFEKVRVSRFRATGVIDPAKNTALIPFPDGKVRLIGVTHTQLKYNGGWCIFVCPKCARRTPTLYLISDAPRCTRCCDAMNIKHASKYGFGREARRKARDKHLDQLIAKLETNRAAQAQATPQLMAGQGHSSSTTAARLTETMRRRMIELRLNQLANQQDKDHAAGNDTLTDLSAHRAAQASSSTSHRSGEPISPETLQQALDNAQITILTALDSDDPQQRLNAAKLMMQDQTSQRSRPVNITGQRTGLMAPRSYWS